MTEKLLWKWVRFGIGVVMFAALMAVHVIYKELHVVILSAPFALMGFDARDLLQSVAGKRE